jgi:hypothetical protein
MSVSRFGHSATLLKSGQVLISGGSDGNDALDSAELYQPADGTFTSAGKMEDQRSNHTATLLPDGRVLIAGGFNDRYLASAELYDPATGHFSPAASMAVARDEHTATLLDDGQLLVVGGMGGNSGPSQYLDSAEIYTP